MISRLRSDKWAVREDAACGLVRFANVAKRAVPALAAVLQRQILDTALDARRPPRPPPPSLDDAPLTNCEDEEREAREKWFSRRVEKADFPTGLHREWRDSYDWQQGRIVWAIRRLEGGEIAARAVLDLFRRDPELRCDYRTVETLLGGLGPTAVPALDEGLRDEIAQIRYFAVRAIPDLRPLPSSAEKLLQRAIDWDHGDVRSAAVAGLEAVRALRRAEKKREEQEKRAAAMLGRDWLSEFPAYPGASKVCSGSSGDPRADGREEAFTIYASKDEPAVVTAFYAEARRVKTKAGARSLRVDAGAKRVSVVPVAESHPECGTRPPKEARSLVVVSANAPK